MQGLICTEILSYACNALLPQSNNLAWATSKNMQSRWIFNPSPWHDHVMLASIYLVLTAVNHNVDVQYQGCTYGNDAMGMQYGCTYAGSWQGMTTDFLDWWVTKLFKVTEALLKCLHSSSAIIVLILCRGLSCYCSLGRDNMDHLKFQYHIDLTPQHDQTFLVIKLIRQEGKLKRKPRIIRIFT